MENLRNIKSFDIFKESLFYDEEETDFWQEGDSDDGNYWDLEDGNFNYDKFFNENNFEISKKFFDDGKSTEINKEENYLLNDNKSKEIEKIIPNGVIVEDYDFNNDIDRYINDEKYSYLKEFDRIDNRVINRIDLTLGSYNVEYYYNMYFNSYTFYVINAYEDNLVGYAIKDDIGKRIYDKLFNIIKNNKKTSN